MNIPIMMQSIKRGEIHTAPFFLQALANNLGHQIDNLVLDTLDSDNAMLRETALSIVKQINLSEAIPKVETLLYDKNPNIALLASQIIKNLKK